MPCLDASQIAHNGNTNAAVTLMWFDEYDAGSGDVVIAVNSFIYAINFEM